LAAVIIGNRWCDHEFVIIATANIITAPSWSQLHQILTDSQNAYIGLLSEKFSQNAQIQSVNLYQSRQKTFSGYLCIKIYLDHSTEHHAIKLLIKQSAAYMEVDNSPMSLASSLTGESVLTFSNINLFVLGVLRNRCSLRSDDVRTQPTLQLDFLEAPASDIIRTYNCTNYTTAVDGPCLCVTTVESKGLAD